MRAGIAAALSMLLLLTAAGADAETEVITSPDRQGMVLERPVLRALFTMRMRQWPDGSAVRVFVLPDSDPVHERFCREWLNTYPYVLRNTWERGVFTGTGFAPEQVGSQQEMIDKVRRTRGAIGYIEKRDGASAAPAGDEGRAR